MEGRTEGRTGQKDISTYRPYFKGFFRLQSGDQQVQLQ